MDNFFSLYDTLASGIPAGVKIDRCFFGERWASCEGEAGVGVAMATVGNSIPPMFPDGLEGLEVRDAVQAVKSWNLQEASVALAAANMYFNTAEHMAELGCAEPFDNYCTAGLDISGKVFGVIGHLNMTDEIHRRAKEIYILERAPKEGDYPDSACDLILPRCDIVLITGSSIINKTLPHLLELCKNAYTILTGPSVPMCPALLEQGIDRLAGMIVTDSAGMTERVRSSEGGSPYRFGQSWLLKK